MFVSMPKPSVFFEERRIGRKEVRSGMMRLSKSRTE